jgi:membrane-associated phospholipid phosphatase
MRQGRAGARGVLQPTGFDGGRAAATCRGMLWSRTTASVLLCSLFALAPSRTVADDVVHPWEAVGKNLEGIYGWPNVMFHVGAFALTPPVLFALDEPVQESLQQGDPEGDPYGESALIVGYIVPPALPIGLYAVGLAAEDSEVATAGAAAIQAVLFQGILIQTLKLFSDRAFPHNDGVEELPTPDGFRHSEDADDFNLNPFDVEHGRAWPSGHTASSFALASSLVAFFPDETWLPFVAYPYAVAIAAGMVEADYHWLSDLVAGALLGHVIGWVVGSNFRQRYEVRRSIVEARAQGTAYARADTGLDVEFSASADPLGVGITGRF